MNIGRYSKILLMATKALCLVLGLLFSSLSLAFAVYFLQAMGDSVLNAYLAASIPSGETYSVAIMLFALATMGVVTVAFSSRGLLSYILTAVNSLLCLVATVLFTYWLPQISPIRWAAALAVVYFLLSTLQLTAEIYKNRFKKE